MDPFFVRFFPGDGDAVEGFHALVEAHLPAAGRLLDLGCGANEQLAPYRTSRREVWGTDFQAHPGLRHARWFRLLGPGGSVPFPEESFDLITACWVLEHVARPRPFLGEVRRLLRPGGTFVALTVHAAHYVTWASRLVGLLPHGVTQRLVQRLYRRPAHDTFPAYYQLNTPLHLEQTAARCGLALTGLRRFANPDYFSFCPPLRRAAVVLDWLLERSGTRCGKLYLAAALTRPAGAAPFLPLVA